MTNVRSPNCLRRELLVEQAIFTSVRGARNEGYQLAAASPGITDDVRRELSQWGPAHDSLHAGRRTAVGFCQLSCGLYAVSKTVVAGEEYSGRSGPRLYTQFFLLPAELYERFSFQPFRILEALVAAGRLQVVDPVPEDLEAFRLVGRASPTQVSMLATVTREIGATRLSTALTAALTTRPLAIAAPGPQERLFAVLIDLLPMALRPQCSAIAGLRFSPRRPYRWFAASGDEKELRRLQRMGDLLLIDLRKETPPRLAPRSGWARLIAGLLAEGRFAEIAQVVRHVRHQPLTECERRADELWAAWKEGGDVEDLFSSRRTQPRSVEETCRTDSGCREAQPTLRDGIAR